MKRKLDLLEVANSLHLSSSNRFYEFARNYILHMKVKGINDTKEFFKAIESIKTNAGSTAIKYALGYSGKGDENIVIAWSESIVNNKDLHLLTLDELHYVMGYANRRCKSKVIKTSNSEHQAEKDNSPHQQIKRPKVNKSNDRKWLPSKDETPLKCKKCSKIFIVKSSKPFPYYRDATCAQCNTKHRYKF